MQDGYYLLSFLICNQNGQFSPVESPYCKGRWIEEERNAQQKGGPYPFAFFSSSLFLFLISLSSMPAITNSSQRSTFITFQVFLTLVLRGLYNIEPILNRTVSLKTIPNLEMLYYMQYSTRQGVPWICWCSFSKYNWVSAEKHLDCSWVMVSWGNNLQHEKEDK